MLRKDHVQDFEGSQVYTNKWETLKSNHDHDDPSRHVERSTFLSNKSNMCHKSVPHALCIVNKSIWHVEVNSKYQGSRGLYHVKRVTRKQTVAILFWYDTDFSEFISSDIIDYIPEKSVSYQKKDGRSHSRPSFFWYDNDKDLKVDDGTWTRS